MSPDRFKAVENLYHAALEIEPERRSAFIEEACAGDDSLRSEVQMLLGLDRQAGDFLGEPAIEVVARQAAQKPRDSLVGWQLGSYELEELVGAGGMGEVYRAHDRSLRRVTAIKLLTEELRSHPQFKQRFLREARAAALLNHPNIAQIYEVGESNGVTYLAMEYVNGETLAAKVGKWQTCPQMVVDVALQTAAALKEAHAAGLIHRDIKPSNVMLTQSGQVKLLDFGLAQFNPQLHPLTLNTTNPPETSPGLVMGTVRYMSPEQLLGRELDSRTDIFSLGVLLYELATGIPPFGGSTTVEVIDEILHLHPPSVAALNPIAPSSLAEAIHKSLEKDPAHRFQSAEELLEALQRPNVESGLKSKTEAPPDRDRTLWRTRTSLIICLCLVLLLVLAVWRGRAWRFGSPPQLQSLAVLPFSNVRSDPEIDYLTEGITTRLIDELSRSKRITVLARTSAFRYKERDYNLQELGRTLRVNAIVTGKISRVDEDLHVEARMTVSADLK